MTVPTLADSLDIARTILGAAFALATVWVAFGPVVRVVARMMRRPARATMPPANAANAEAASSKASRAA